MRKVHCFGQLKLTGPQGIFRSLAFSDVLVHPDHLEETSLRVHDDPAPIEDVYHCTIPANDPVFVLLDLVRTGMGPVLVNLRLLLRSSEWMNLLRYSSLGIR